MINGETMTLRTLLQSGRERLFAAPCPDENYANEAFYLFHKLFGVSREQLVFRGEETVSPEEAARYYALLDQRAAGEPLQYLLGEWEFYGLPMEVGSGVLIPRPETEELVERVLSYLKPVEAPIVLDLCSGSGCIPIAIGHCRPTAQVYGVELSEDAYSYFTRNVARNQIKNVTPVKSDVFALPQLITLRHYHAITANPPYIATAELDSLQAEVHHEPAMALNGGEDGLLFYRSLPTIAMGLLLPGGLLALEIGEKQGEQVSVLLTKAGFEAVTICKDLSGNDRIVTGIAP
ncbi:MAG: peptide chain release factor N(5)-glutamine methyltransferase [Angelakisella sp.]